MGDVIHLHAPPIGRGVAARASKVISDWPFSAAKDTSRGQRCAGMPRVRQLDTVERLIPSRSATAAVPPSRSMVVSTVSMPRTIVHSLRTCQEFTANELTAAPANGEIQAAMAYSLKEQARRLAATREALGYAQQTDLCRALDIKKNHWNPFEKGSRRIPLDVAMTLRERFSIPLDWTYYSDPLGLPSKLRQDIEKRMRLVA